MQAALIANIAGAALGAMGTMQAAKAEKAQAERNAYIGKTRAMQTDTAIRGETLDDMAAMRATLAANGQTAGSAVELFRALRDSRSQQRRVEFSNRMQEASDWRMQGRNALSQGRWKAASQLASAGPSLFQIYAMRGRNG